MTSSGWRICDSGEAPPSTQVPIADGSWQLTSGPCVETGSCISSPGYPDNYGNGQACEISIDGMVMLEVEAFSTESGYDRLFVDGAVFQGSVGPQNGAMATGAITWSSDGSVTQSGWKICTTVPAEAER